MKTLLSLVAIATLGTNVAMAADGLAQNELVVCEASYGDGPLASKQFFAIRVDENGFNVTIDESSSFALNGPTQSSAFYMFKTYKREDFQFSIKEFEIAKGAKLINFEAYLSNPEDGSYLGRISLISTLDYQGMDIPELHHQSHYLIIEDKLSAYELTTEGEMSADLLQNPDNIVTMDHLVRKYQPDPNGVLSLGNQVCKFNPAAGAAG